MRTLAEPYRLELPIDASEIAGRRADEPVKVAVVDAAGTIRATVVRLDERGRGAARFGFAEEPGPLRVLLGPETAGDATLPERVTIAIDVPAGRFRFDSHATLPPIVIPAFYWEVWRRWCRTFVVRGRVVGLDGRAIAGAAVTAFAVDAWWWFASRETVGTATTDACGAFTLRFAWSCGFAPGPWWRRRTWQRDPALADAIATRIAGAPHLPRVAPAIDPVALAALQPRLTRAIPPAPELAAIGLWPWARWAPWFATAPDLIFRAARTRGAGAKQLAIVDESLLDVRRAVPTVLEVTLVSWDTHTCA